MLDTLDGDVRAPPRARLSGAGRPAAREAAIAGISRAERTCKLKEKGMSQTPNVDGILLQWGDRLFLSRQPDRPGEAANRKLNGLSARQRAAAIRERIEATVVRRAPQVMVKVTGGGAGHEGHLPRTFRYISKNGRLEIENERGPRRCAARTCCANWPMTGAFGGSLIDDNR